VLYLCFNQRLAASNRAAVAELGISPETNTFHRFAELAALEAGITIPPRPQKSDELSAYFGLFEKALEEAMKKNSELRFDALVIDEGQLVGIFSERDYARKGILKGRASQQTLIKDVMTSKLITVTSEQKLEEAMVIMSEKHIRHLPVVDEGELIGIISINDVVSSIIKEQKARIESLESYISGSPY
jgi:CBS domain-containing protein